MKLGVSRMTKRLWIMEAHQHPEKRKVPIHCGAEVLPECEVTGSHGEQVTL